MKIQCSKNGTEDPMVKKKTIKLTWRREKWKNKKEIKWVARDIPVHLKEL
jgi:hypothetical protein